MCKRRPAVFLRTYSGEKLCTKCLETALEKGVFRSLARPRILKPKSRLLVPVYLSLPSFSLAIARTITRIEKSFGSEVILALPTSIKARTPQDLKVVEVDINVDRLPSDAISCLRLEKRWSLSIARSLGADAVVIPLTRTLMNLIMLNALLAGRPEGVSEAEPWTTSAEPPIISGLWAVESELVAAYIALKDLYTDPVCRLDLSLAKKVFYSVAGRRPELEFSSAKSLSLLEKGLDSVMERCPLCAGYTLPGEKPCRYCSSTTLEVTARSLVW